jgi:hypothetical protein
MARRCNHPYEHVLRQRLGVLSVSSHTQTERVNPIHMGAVDALESIRVA